MKIPEQRVPRGKGSKLGHWTTGAAVPLLTVTLPLPAPRRAEAPLFWASASWRPRRASLRLGRAARAAAPCPPCGARLVRPGSCFGHRAASFPDSRGLAGTLSSPRRDSLFGHSGANLRTRGRPACWTLCTSPRYGISPGSHGNLNGSTVTPFHVGGDRAPSGHHPRGGLRQGWSTGSCRPLA